jgi:hypothetical protein
MVFSNRSTLRSTNSRSSINSRNSRRWCSLTRPRKAGRRSRRGRVTSFFQFLLIHSKPLIPQPSPIAPNRSVNLKSGERPRIGFVRSIFRNQRRERSQARNPGLPAPAHGPREIGFVRQNLWLPRNRSLQTDKMLLRAPGLKIPKTSVLTRYATGCAPKPSSFPTKTRRSSITSFRISKPNGGPRLPPSSSRSNAWP